MRVLVTGASGFIGLPLLDKLSKDGHDVLAISRSKIINLPCNVSWIESDISQHKTYKDYLRQFSPEVIVHLAWQDIPDYSIEKSISNLYNSINIISFVLGLGCCEKVIVSGSCFELNQLQGECLEVTKGESKDHFTWAKHSLYSWLEMMCKQLGMDLLWMRIFYVYGPRQRPETLIPSIITSLKSGQLPSLKTPKNANDFVYIDDVVDAFSKAVLVDSNSMIYNIGSGISTPVLDICRIAENIVLGTDMLTKEMEDSSKDVTCDVDFWANYTNSKKYLSWKPNTSIEDGINKTWQSLKSK